MSDSCIGRDCSYSHCNCRDYIDRHCSCRDCSCRDCSCRGCSHTCRRKRTNCSIGSGMFGSRSGSTSGSMSHNKSGSMSGSTSGSCSCMRLHCMCWHRRVSPSTQTQMPQRTMRPPHAAVSVQTDTTRAGGTAAHDRLWSSSRRTSGLHLKRHDSQQHAHRTRGQRNQTAPRCRGAKARPS